jgi:hypothetical protein
MTDGNTTNTQQNSIEDEFLNWANDLKLDVKEVACHIEDEDCISCGS